MTVIVYVLLTDTESA